MAYKHNICLTSSYWEWPLLYSVAIVYSIALIHPWKMVFFPPFRVYLGVSTCLGGSSSPADSEELLRFNEVRFTMKRQRSVELNTNVVQSDISIVQVSKLLTVATLFVLIWHTWHTCPKNWMRKMNCALDLAFCGLSRLVEFGQCIFDSTCDGYDGYDGYAERLHDAHSLEIC